MNMRRLSIHLGLLNVHDMLLHIFSLIFTMIHSIWQGLPRLCGKESSCYCRRGKFNPWVRKNPWSRTWQPTLVFCLENSRDRKAWQVTVHGFTKSWTQLSMHTRARAHTHTHTRTKRAHSD